VPIFNDADSALICKLLEKQGYKFDEFSAYEIGLKVTYPNGIKKRFRQAYEISTIILIDMTRDYNNPDIFSGAEYKRLEALARTFFDDFQKIVTEKKLRFSISGGFYWNIFNGVRGGFRFSPTGKITGSYGWSTGSYANSYELNQQSSCPSGRVIH
jgi:hypothetical protein